MKEAGLSNNNLTSIYKYLPEKYLDSFLLKGEIVFRSLSYYQHIEDKNRQDFFEGKKLYKPESGLEVTNTKTGEKLLLPDTSFLSNANANDIFVFCTSNTLSTQLAKKFNTSICVEIKDLTKFKSSLRNAILIRSCIKNKQLISGKINYYSSLNPPLVDWAFPERIAMSKLDFYVDEDEFRFIFGRNNALQVYNSQQSLVMGNQQHYTPQHSYPEKILRIGNISKICKVHTLNPT